MARLLTDVEATLGSIRRGLRSRETAPTHARGDIGLLPPITRPGKIIAVGRNYHEHAAEEGKTAPAAPIIFAKFPSSLVADRADIVWRAADTGQVDYEAELAVVIGRTARDVPPSRAFDHVLGYTCLNDGRSPVTNATLCRRATWSPTRPWRWQMARRRGGPLADERSSWRSRRRVAAREPIASVAVSVGRSSWTVSHVLNRSGGLPPRTPTVRSGFRLTVAEREEISRGLLAGESLRPIAAGLGRSPSTVSRRWPATAAASVPGVAGRGPGRPRPCPATATRQARPQRCPARGGRGLLDALVTAADRGLAAARVPDEPEMRVSHETIYLSLFVQAPRCAAQGADRAACAAGARTRRPRGRRHRRPGASCADMVHDQRAAGRGRGPGGARPLGRRPAHRHGRRSASRTLVERHDPLRDAGRPAARPATPSGPRRAGRSSIRDAARRSCAGR